MNEVNTNELLGELKNSLDQLNNKIDSQNKRIEIMADKIAKLEGASSQVGGLSPVPPPPPPPPPHYEKSSDKKNNQAVEVLTKAFIGGYVEEGSRELPVPEKENIVEKQTVSENQGSLEERIGGKWFAKIGIVVMILGMSFFLKYAFDNEWIGETGRIILGVIVGLSLLAFGEKTIRKYFMYGQIVSGGGLAIIYLSIFASYNFYHLVGQSTAFLFMGFVTMIGIALSLRYNAPSLIIFSTLGGFATPYLVSSGVNNQVGLFAYIAILDMAVLAVSYFKQWRWLNLIGFVGTVIMFSGWHGTYYSKDQLFGTMVFATIFFAIYSLSSLIYNLAKKEMSSGFEQLMTLFSGLLFFAYSYLILNPEHHAFMGFFALSMALYYFIWAYAVKVITPKDANLYNFLAFLSIGFITIAIPIQFDKYIITISWLVEATLLLYAGTRQTERNGVIMKVFGVFIMACGLDRLLFIDPQYTDIHDLIFVNKVFLSALVAIVAQYLVAYAFKTSPTGEAKELFVFNKKTVVTIFLVLASLISVYAVTREIQAYNDNQIRLAQIDINEHNKTIETQYGKYEEYMQKLDNEKVRLVEERNAATVSVFWLIYAILILSIGISKKEKALAVFGTSLCLIVAIKLFAYELWEMDTFYRPIISVSTIFSAYFVACLYYLYSKTGEEKNFLEPFKVFVLFIVIANVLTIFAVSRDIYAYHDKSIAAHQKKLMESCEWSPYSSQSSGRDYDKAGDCEQIREQIIKIQSRASISISIFWLIYAIILITIGFVKRFKWVRIGGITLLGVAIFKLFFIDLWNLGQLYRIIASISLGLVLLAISFVYQKYKHLFKEII
jgi:uncharacterized membrane protein